MNPRTTPRSTRCVTRDGTHSSSMGREAVRPTHSASSVSENAGSNTCWPTFPPRGEMPCSTALPDRACVTGKSSAARPAGVNTTGSAPSGGATMVSARASRAPIESTMPVTARSGGRSDPSTESPSTSTSSPAMRHASLGRFALDRHVHAAAVARQPLEQTATDADQLLEGSVGGPIDERRDGSNGGRARKREIDLLADLGRGQRAGDQLVGGRVGGGRAGDAHAAPVAHAQGHSRLLRHAPRLESPPLEHDRGVFDTAPQRVRAAVRPLRGEIEQPLDHAATSPATSASSIRTCGAPSVTGSGYCPPLPQPPPIWFQRKSPAIWSIRSRVWKRLPANTTSLTSSAIWPSRIM